MTADQVIEIRKLWAQYNFGVGFMPDATVLAERDWLAYARGMASMVPESDVIVWPSREEVAWAWPDGLLIVFAEPVEINHTIISTSKFGFGGNQIVSPTEPHPEGQKVAGLAVFPEGVVPTRDPRGDSPPDLVVTGAPCLWISEDPHDCVTGWWLPGATMHAMGGMTAISESSRFLMSVISALGHRLTKIAVPPYQGRGERRRVERELPGLRVLQLSSGERVQSDTEPGSVEWSHRWMVRAHWRQQPCGAQNKFRRLKWIDPYVKGPADKPLDVRTTLWTTGHVPEELASGEEKQ